MHFPLVLTSNVWLAGLPHSVFFRHARATWAIAGFNSFTLIFKEHTVFNFHPLARQTRKPAIDPALPVSSQADRPGADQRPEILSSLSIGIP
jgi:hypothetical protein